MQLKFPGKTMGRYLAFTVVVMLFGVVVANASPITYSVNRTIGIGSVTGFIETDGTLGGLTAANVVDWSLLLNDGTSTYTITGPLSGSNSVVYSQGADVTASATQLLFNFSGVDNGIFLFQQGLFSGTHYYCDATQTGACFAGETVVPISVFSSYQNAPRSGDVVIGTAGGSAVPEPGTYGLMLTGLGILMRKRSSLGSLWTNLKKS